MDISNISFLWTWLTPDQWATLAKACAIGIGITEVVKRGALLREAQNNPDRKPEDLKGLGKFTMWLLAITITSICAGVETLRLTGVMHPGDLTFAQSLDILLFTLLAGPFAPLAHWLMLLQGADFLAWLIEKRTGYNPNLRAIAAGRTYKVTKRVRLADGTLVDRPIDEPTNHDAGDRTQLPEDRQ